MMRTFYGVHLKSSALSIALDLVRYFAEPDNLRFSHITLRGPYSRPLSAAKLEEINTSRARDWSVRLAGPGNFFSDHQNTVIIKIDLLDLEDLVHKPDFIDGIPHLTLYDGKDRSFAQALLNLLYKFDFHQILDVSHLGRLPAKAPIGGDFILIYEDFYKMYCKYVGQEATSVFAKSLRSSEKLGFIERVLSENFKSHYSRLERRTYGVKNFNMHFNFD